MHANIRFSPFLLPSQTSSIYFSLNVISIYATFSGFALLSLGGLAWLIIFPVGLSAVTCIWFEYNSKRLVKSSTEINPGRLARLRQVLPGLPLDIAFRSTSEGDARVVLSSSQYYCLINDEDISSAASASPDYKSVRSQFIVAHELSHVISNDVSGSRMAITLAALGISTIAICLSAMIFKGFELKPTASIGFVYLVLVYSSQLYWVLRTREIYADKISGVIIGAEKVLQVLSTEAQAEKFIRFSVWNRLTHPPLTKRLQIFCDFRQAYRFSMDKVLSSSLILSFVFVLFPLGMFVVIAEFETSGSISSMLGLCIAAIMYLFTMYFPFHVVFQNVVEAALVDRLKLSSVTMKGLLIWLGSLLGVGVLALLILPDDFWKVLPKYVSVSGLFAFTSLLAILHWSYWLWLRTSEG